MLVEIFEFYLNQMIIDEENLVALHHALYDVSHLARPPVYNVYNIT